MPSFRNQVIIPLLLSPDRDDELAVSITDQKQVHFKVAVCLYGCHLCLGQKLTEQRVSVFSHEIVPDYLRTKPDPEVEEQEKQLSTEAARIGPELAQVSEPSILSCQLLTGISWLIGYCFFSQQKQIQALNKLCSNLLEKLNNPRDDRDTESAGKFHLPFLDSFTKMKICAIYAFLSIFQPYDRTNNHSTQLIQTLQSVQLHLEKVFLSADHLAPWPLDIQDRSP